MFEVRSGHGPHAYWKRGQRVVSGRPEAAVAVVQIQLWLVPGGVSRQCVTSFCDQRGPVVPRPVASKKRTGPSSAPFGGKDAGGIASRKLTGSRVAHDAKGVEGRATHDDIIPAMANPAPPPIPGPVC